MSARCKSGSKDVQKGGRKCKKFAAAKAAAAAERERLSQAEPEVQPEADPPVAADSQPASPAGSKRARGSDACPPPPPKRACPSPKAAASASASKKPAAKPAKPAVRKACVAAAAAGPERLSRKYTIAQNRYHPYRRDGRSEAGAVRSQQREQQKHTHTFERQVQKDPEKARSALAGALRQPEIRPHLPAMGIILAEDAAVDTTIVDELATTVSGLAEGSGTKRRPDAL